LDEPVPSRDSAYFTELQTHTGWGRTLYGFAQWCEPQPGWLTLDVGCGPGLLPAIFSKFGCTSAGVDLDEAMFQPSPLHPIVAVGNVYQLPFQDKVFNLVTCSNLVFMLSQPVSALQAMKRLLIPGGLLAMLNPSENLDERVASAYADEIGLAGIARSTLLNWARRASENQHWTDEETCALFRQAGFEYKGSVLKVGPGFARFSSGIA
jgi:ubiquinone/menaquinone biosynthesis C-methylase UbiE